MFNGVHVINIDDLDTSMSREINEKGTSIIVHKIQQHIKDKKAYEPSNFSIGPYPCRTPELSATQKMKWAYLNNVLQLNPEKKLQDYVQAINGLEKQARQFYADEIKMDRKSFVEMLLIDGCFILMAFNGTDGIIPDYNMVTEGTNDENENGEENYFENGQFYTKYIVRDVLLLENQIPFFVIKKIYELVAGGRSETSLLMKNVFESMKDMLIDCYPNAISESNRPKEFHHLLHLCHMYFKPTKIETESCQNYVRKPSPFNHFLQLSSKFFNKNNQTSSHDHQYKTQMKKQTINQWRRATQYNQARIELKKREYCDNDPHSLLDIRFCNGTLNVPCLTIDQETSDLFRNLIAFEQTCPQIGNYITAYVVFLYYFVTIPDDVALLVEKGIIKHHLHSDKEVSDLFKSLRDGIDYDYDYDFNGEHYLKYICHSMEEHYQIWRPRWREWLGSIASKIPHLNRKTKSELPIRV